MSNNSTQWQTLSPFALLYFIAHFCFRFLKDGLLNILPPFTVLLFQVENKLLWFSIGAITIVIAVFTYALLFFLCFKFKLNEDEVQLQRGILKKQQLNLNFAKIQNVNISAPFYFRPFNLVNAQLDAAGSKGQEVVLPGIEKEMSEQLREQVFSYGQSHNQLAEQGSNSEQTQPVLNLSNFEVAKFGLYSSTIFLLLASVATFQRHIEPFFKEQLLTPLTEQYLLLTSNQQMASNFAFISLAGGFILAMVLFSVAIALLRFYNFEIKFEDEKIKRTCGLLERTQFSLQKSKIQSIELKQNIISLLLKRFTLNCKQINNSTPNKAKKQSIFMLPVLTKQQSDRILDLCLSRAIRLNQVQFAPIAIEYFYKALLIFSVLPTLIACVIGFQTIDINFIAALVGYFVVTALLSYLRYKRHGYAFYQDFAIVRKGLFGVNYTFFEFHKIQRVGQIQSKMMERKSLASLKFGLASGSVTVPYIPVSQSEQQIDLSLHLVQSSSRSWM